jgi:hypothetical protein
MQTAFKRGDIVEVQDVHGRDCTFQGIYIAHDPTSSNPHVVHLIGRKYGRAKFNQCRLANSSEQ